MFPAWIIEMTECLREIQFREGAGMKRDDDSAHTEFKRAAEYI